MRSHTFFVSTTSLVVISYTLSAQTNMESCAVAVGPFPVATDYCDFILMRISFTRSIDYQPQ